jgi:hypothetical protein
MLLTSGPVRSGPRTNRLPNRQLTGRQTSVESHAIGNERAGAMTAALILVGFAQDHVRASGTKSQAVKLRNEPDAC